MPQIRTPLDKANLAEAYALTANLVEFMGEVYLPVHFLTGKPSPILKPDETVWIRMDKPMIRAVANGRLDILFVTDAEERSFKLMLEQFAKSKFTTRGLLVRHGTNKLKVLMPDGTMKKVTGNFNPNYLNVPYDKTTLLADELYGVICDWVGGKQQATSLLYHLATALQSDYSARKYVLLIGDGYNGKGTLIKMIHALFGDDNISGVTRQEMAARRPTITQLNGKLINLVYDGPKDFVKDSSTEKTLIAGEPIWIEIKYENGPRKVQSNCLFIEALNTEPKVGDKSPALQKRLARFRFPNVYAPDEEFLARMLSPDMIAAFLHLLMKHWVPKNELADKLALTAESLDMQMQAMWDINPVIRFMEWVHDRDNKFLSNIVDGKMIWDLFMNRFRDWLDSNGYKNMEDDYLMSLMKNNFVDGRKSFRIEGKGPSTKRYIQRVLPDTLNAINVLLSGEHIGEMSESDKAILADMENGD